MRREGMRLCRMHSGSPSGAKPFAAPLQRALMCSLVAVFGCQDPAPAEGPDAGPPELSSAAHPPAPPPPPPRVPQPVPEPEAEPAPVAPPQPSAEERARARAEAARRAFREHYPKSGIVFHFLARVRTRPHHEAPVLGYMRRGARFAASGRIPGVGCRRGWHEVPGGGFVCRGEGFLIDDEAPSFEPVPVPPALQNALPYAYAYAPRDDIAQFWHLPSVEEERLVAERFSERRRLRQREAEEAEREAERAEREARRAAREAQAQNTESQGETESEAEETDGPDDGAEAAEAPPPPGTVAAPPEPGEELPEGLPTTPATEVAAAAIQNSSDIEIPDYVRMRMQRGFYISLDEEVRDGSRRFFRTVRGAYVRADRLITNEPPAHRGVVLGGNWQLPVGFVWRGGTSRLQRRGRRLQQRGRIDKHTPLRIAETMERAGRSFVVARNGDVVRRSSVRMAEAIERPEGVEEGERWLHIDLGEQMLVAYEGNTPVFVTTISSGRDGFETPTGLFRIQSKHVSTTMDDLTSEEDAYLIEDVPWTMYFEGNFALHAAFWHQHFGRQRSHGCINLAPADARWLFQWSGPTLPAAWHGVFANADSPGTPIYITE